jgi:ferredoxin
LVGTASIADMNVSVDLDLCSATAGCTQVAPDVFRLSTTGIIEVLIAEPGEDLREVVLEAADLCPTAAISVTA